MEISVAQYQKRANFLCDLLKSYIDNEETIPFQRAHPPILIIAVPKSVQERIVTFLRILHLTVESKESPHHPNMWLHINLNISRFSQRNTLAAFKEFIPTKYFIINFDAILNGEEGYPSEEDIVLETHDCGNTHILKNGYELIKSLNGIKIGLGYTLVLYSKQGRKDLELRLQNLHAACIRHGLLFPTLHATTTYEESNKEISIATAAPNAPLSLVWDPLPAEAHFPILSAAQRIFSTSYPHTYHVVLETGEHLSFTTNGTDQFVTALTHMLEEGKKTRTSSIRSIQAKPRVSFLIPKPSTTELPPLQQSEPMEQQTSRSPLIQFSLFPTTDLQTRPGATAPEPNSLTLEQRLEVETMISHLERKIAFSCLDPNQKKIQTQEKIAILKGFMKNCKRMEIQEAVNIVEKTFPDFYHGKIRDLLGRLSGKILVTSV